MINKIKKVKYLSDISSNIINYDVFDNEIIVTTESGDKYALDYNISIEEKVLNKMGNLENKLRNKLNIVNKDIKLFNKGLIVVNLYTLSIIILSILFSSFIPLIFLISSLFIGCKILTVLKQLNKEYKEIDLNLFKLKSNLSCKKIESNLKYNSILLQEDKYNSINYDEKISSLSCDQLKQISEKLGGKESEKDITIELEKRINLK